MDVQPSAQMEKQRARPWLWLNTSRMISCYFQVWDSGNNLQLWWICGWLWFFWFKAIRENSGINLQAPTQGFVGRIDCKTMRKLQELTSQRTDAQNWCVHPTCEHKRTYTGGHGYVVICERTAEGILYAERRVCSWLHYMVLVSLQKKLNGWDRYRWACLYDSWYSSD